MKNISKVVCKIISFPFWFIFVLVLFPVCFPILYIIITIPCFIYKQFVILLAKCFLKNPRILCGKDNSIAMGKVYENNNCYVSLQLIGEGRMDFQTALNIWNQRIINKMRENGEHCFPELTSYVKPFFGYSFYVPDESFDLKHHIKCYNIEDTNNTGNKSKVIITREKLDQIIKNGTNKLFENGKSPWEALIVNDYIIDENSKEDGKEYSVLIFKFHHCLADGFSALFLLIEGLAGIDIPPLNFPNLAKRTQTLDNIFFAICSDVLKTIFLMGNSVFNFLWYDNLCCLCARTFNSKTYQDIHKSSNNETLRFCLPPIKTALIKEISAANNCSVTTVITALCVGGYDKMMKAFTGLPPPKNPGVFYSVPLPDHPDRLMTHSAITYIHFPVHDSDTRQKLQKTEHNLKIAVRRIFSFGDALIDGLLRTVPLSVNIGPIVRFSFGGATISSVPLPSNVSSKFYPFKLIQVYFQMEALWLNYSPAGYVLKYNDHFFITIGINKYLAEKYNICKSDVEKYILEELQHLRNEVVV